MKKLLKLIQSAILVLLIIVVASCQAKPSSKHKVTFMNGSETISTVETSDLQKLEKPIDPTLNEANFEGWFISDDSETPFEFTGKLTEDVILIARFSAIVTFNVDGGQEINNQKVFVGKNVVKPENPIKDNYNFLGWFVDNAKTTEFDFLQPINGNITIYAKWEQKPVEIEVEFFTYGAAEIPKQTVVYGQGIVMPTEPKKDGFVFAGWYWNDTFTRLYHENDAITMYTQLFANFIDSDTYSLLEQDIDSLGLPISANANITLPTTSTNGSRLFYRSLDLKYLSDSGQVHLAEYNTDGATARIDVRASLGGFNLVKTVEINIEALPEEIVDKSVTATFTSHSSEYIVENGNIDIYYMKNGTIPYVNISDFITLLDGAIDSVKDEPKEITDDDGSKYMVVKYMEIVEINGYQIAVRYIEEYSQNEEVVETVNYEMVIDFDLNKVTTPNFNFFNALGSETETDFGEGLTFGEVVEIEGKEISIDFNKYRIDLVTYDQDGIVKYLVPQSVANLIFVGQVYYNTYFNGETMHGVDTYQIMDNTPEALDVVRTIKRSPLNSLEMPNDIKRFNYDFIALTFDHFYGLKPDPSYTYYNKIERFANNLLYSSVKNEHYASVFSLVYSMDDMHTYHSMSGYFSPSYRPTLSAKDLGQRTLGYYEGYWAIEDHLTNNPVLPSRVTPDGKTGIVTIESFDVETPTKFKEDVDALIASNAGIKNIVVDISNNGGGNVGAVWRTLGYMTDDPIMFHSQNIFDESKYSQEIIDLYPAYDLNFFILTSSITFSAANLMASTAKEMNIATVIGLPSSGGGSSITAVVTPTGDIFFMSSLSTMSTKNADGSIVSVEYGVTPNILFNSIGQLYDDNYIQNIVNNSTNN